MVASAPCARASKGTCLIASLLVLDAQAAKQTLNPGQGAHPLITQGKELRGASRTLNSASDVNTTCGVSWRPSRAYSPKVPKLNSRLVAALQWGEGSKISPNSVGSKETSTLYRLYSTQHSPRGTRSLKRQFRACMCVPRKHMPAIWPGGCSPRPPHSPGRQFTPCQQQISPKVDTERIKVLPHPQGRQLGPPLPRHTCRKQLLPGERLQAGGRVGRPAPLSFLVAAQNCAPPANALWSSTISAKLTGARHRCMAPRSPAQQQRAAACAGDAEAHWRAGQSFWYWIGEQSRL